MMINSVAAGGANASLDLNTIMASKLTGLDPASIANGLLARVQGGESLGQMLGELKGQLSPVDQGNVLRALDQSGATGLTLAQDFPLPGQFDPKKILSDILNEAVNRVGDFIIGKAIDFGNKGLDWLNDKANQIKDKLASLPSDAANAVADSMRGPKARTLTSGEQAQLNKIFSNRSIDLSNVRIVDGAGNNPAAAAAFRNGNPAITIGNTVYVKPGTYAADFSKTPKGIELLAHEFTHVEQYQRLGFGSFGVKYAKDLASVGGDPNKAYRYETRNTTFKTETLEGQAQMVGNYAEYKAGGKNLTAAQVKDVENRLKGTGFFGL
jgi:Domain of unknown function (DUF4157)